MYFIKPSSLFKGISFTLFLMCFCLEIVAQSNDRPNIVWLVSEDNSKHYMQLYESGGAPMPNIEALAKKGVVFNNAFSNAPVCSVARSTIISGCLAPRVGAQYHRRMQLAPMPDGLEMFPQYLKKAGYYTTNNAKQDYNFIKSKAVWDESSRKASYQNRKKGQPFFHVQNYGTTHEGRLHFSEKQMQENNNLELTDNVLPYHPNTKTFQYTNAAYRNLHTKVDAQMGEFLDKLKADGLLENTIIFYYGDHGGVLPRSKGYAYESGLHVPMVVYVPEKWKHLMPIKAGTRTNAFVQFIDLAPTILNLAGIKVPAQMDGKPFLGKNVSKSDLEKRNTTFGYADRFDEKYDLVRTIRKGKYKYMRNYQPFNIDGLFNFYRYRMLAYKEWQQLFDERKLNEIQQQFFKPRSPEALYNLENDPHETVNLANNPNMIPILEELRGNLQTKVKSMPDLSFYPEPYFLENGLGNPVAFGQKSKTNIAELIAIADLQLLPFSKAKKEIKKALKSSDPWKRYWGLIACSSFGENAKSFFKKAEKIAKTDSERLVQIRAIEFLALNHQPVNKEQIISLLKNASSKTEANLMLNSIALIKSTQPDFNINIPKSIFDPEWIKRDGDLVKERVDFINQNK